MKRFLKIYKKDKENIKIINQTESGFELAFLSNDILLEFLEVINTCEEQNDNLYLVWQMKFKPSNYILYKNCTFSTPMENRHPEHTKKILGKKLQVKCDSVSFYSDSLEF